jgi:hypothetical protein
MTINYKVGNQKIANKFLAFRESKIQNKILEFDLHEEIFDRAKWDKEPSMSWDDLLDIRAQQISAKKKPIILGFSGGTDSMTIWEVFKRNNISIHGMHFMIKYQSEQEWDLYRNVIPFIKSEAEKYKFKLLIIEQDSNETLSKFYETPEWVFSDLAVRINVVCPERHGIESNTWPTNFIDQDYIYVTGLDKPRHKIIDNQFYIYNDDTTFLNYHDSRVDNFFINPELPELHIKQSYLLAKYIISKAIIENKPLAFYNNIHMAKNRQYYDYAVVGCGRFGGDIANSHLQKVLNREQTLIIPDNSNNSIRYVSRSQKIINEAFRSNNTFIKNYVAGLQMLRKDSIIKDIFRDPLNYYSVIDIESKKYALDKNLIPANLFVKDTR